MKNVQVYSLDISGACIATKLTAYPKKKNISDWAIIHHKYQEILFIHIIFNQI